MKLQTTDNSQENLEQKIEEKLLINKIAGRSINELCNDNPGLLIIPGQHKDDVEKATICTVHNSILHTQNIIGFIGIRDDQGKNLELRIHSRFDDTSDKQYFFQYMLQRVFCPTVLDLKIDYSSENIHEFFLAIPYIVSKTKNGYSIKASISDKQFRLL